MITQPTVSGKTGQAPEANSALWRVVIVHMTCDQRTRDYVTRRTAEGLSKPEIMRCLKRYVAREVFPYVRAITETNSTTNAA